MNLTELKEFVQKLRDSKSDYSFGLAGNRTCTKMEALAIQYFNEAIEKVNELALHFEKIEKESDKERLELRAIDHELIETILRLSLDKKKSLLAGVNSELGI